MNNLIGVPRFPRPLQTNAPRKSRLEVQARQLIFWRVPYYPAVWIQRIRRGNREHLAFGNVIETNSAALEYQAFRCLATWSHRVVARKVNRYFFYL